MAMMMTMIDAVGQLRVFVILPTVPHVDWQLQVMLGVPETP